MLNFFNNIIKKNDDNNDDDVKEHIYISPQSTQQDNGTVSPLIAIPIICGLIALAIFYYLNRKLIASWFSPKENSDSSVHGQAVQAPVHGQPVLGHA
jgi:hypothetical protein